MRALCKGTLICYDASYYYLYIYPHIKSPSGGFRPAPLASPDYREGDFSIFCTKLPAFNKKSKFFHLFQIEKNSIALPCRYRGEVPTGKRETFKKRGRCIAATSSSCMYGQRAKGSRYSVWRVLVFLDSPRSNAMGLKVFAMTIGFSRDPLSVEGNVLFAALLYDQLQSVSLIR